MARATSSFPVPLSPVISTGVRVFFNRCRHRANLVCHLERGQAKAFVCPYHGWSYALDGHLTGRSFEEAYAGSPPPDEFALTPISRVESYRGFLFGTLNMDALPLREHLGAITPVIDRTYALADAAVLELAGRGRHEPAASLTATPGG